MSHWVRLWEDMPTDPKWRVIARRSGRPIAEVLSVFCFMLTNAGGSRERGTLDGWNDEDVGAALDMEPEHVAAIRDAMQGKTLDGGRLTGWERRQPKRERDDDKSTERVQAFRERQRHETPGNATERLDKNRVDTETEKTEAATAASCAAAAVERLDEKEVERRCIQATGWQNTQGVSAIIDLIAEGHDLEDRILPMLRTISGELKNQGRDPPRMWAFAMKAIRDPSRRPAAAEKPVEMAWVPVGSAGWHWLLKTKRESYLMTMVKPDSKGGQGIWWLASALPRDEAAA